MPKAIRVHEHGGPEKLIHEDVPTQKPGTGEALIRHTAIGLNFLDVYYRTGLYPAPGGMPFVPGNEGAGVVEEVGAGVTGLKPGDRVTYVGPLGAYAQFRRIAADRLLKLPDGIGDEQAGAMMLKGMTVAFLLLKTYQVKPGDTVLFHAAAGGVGLMFGRWAKHLGATVIGTAGSPEKVALAKANGYDHVINYRTENFVERVRDITDGRKCDVVYDSVGIDTFAGSLDCLRPMGMAVAFGQSSGPIPPLNLSVLAQKGSLYVTRPTLFVYIAKRADLEFFSSALFDVVERGVLDIQINQRYALADAARAHAELEARKTTGTSVFLP